MAAKTTHLRCATTAAADMIAAALRVEFPGEDTSPNGKSVRTTATPLMVAKLIRRI